MFTVEQTAPFAFGTRKWTQFRVWIREYGDVDPGRGTTRAEDARGTPTQSHVSPSILVYEGNMPKQNHAQDVNVRQGLAGAGG